MGSSVLSARVRTLGVHWAVIAALAVLAMGMLFWFDPAHCGFYPLCPFHKVTGLLCPGCGSLRALHQLLHGHLIAAFRYNPLLILFLPVGLGVTAAFAARKARHQPATGVIRPIWLWLLLAVSVVFSVWRNLPGAPFIPPS